MFPIKFATQVAATDDSQLQNVLMDAFDEGIVTTTNFAQARRIITARLGKPKKTGPPKIHRHATRHDIAEATEAKSSYVREAKTKENRFMTLLNGINALWKDPEFLQLLREENLPNVRNWRAILTTNRNPGEHRMIANGKPVRGLDVPIVKLVPRNERKVSKKYVQRIEASLRAVGLIDPLIVFPQGDSYEILDGCLRYRILLEMGVETVPCLIGQRAGGFYWQPDGQPARARSRRCGCCASRWKSWTRRRSPTPWGCRASPPAEHEPAEKARSSRRQGVRGEQVEPAVRQGADHVKPERQAEILQVMESCNDYSVTFARGLVLKTPVAKRAKVNGARTPWTRPTRRRATCSRSCGRPSNSRISTRVSTASTRRTC